MFLLIAAVVRNVTNDQPLKLKLINQAGAKIAAAERREHRRLAEVLASRIPRGRSLFLLLAEVLAWFRRCERYIIDRMEIDRTDTNKEISCFEKRSPPIQIRMNHICYPKAYGSETSCSSPDRLDIQTKARSCRVASGHRVIRHFQTWREL